MTVPLAGLFMTTILQRLSASIVAKEECTTVSNISTLLSHNDNDNDNYNNNDNDDDNYNDTHTLKYHCAAVRALLQLPGHCRGHLLCWGGGRSALLRIHVGRRRVGVLTASSLILSQ